MEMAGGKTPDEACRGVIDAIAERLRRAKCPMFEVALLAVNTAGEVGAGSTFGDWRDHVTGERWPGFPYAVTQVTAITYTTLQPEVS